MCKFFYHQSAKGKFLAKVLPVFLLLALSGCGKDDQCSCAVTDKTGTDPLAIAPFSLNVECAFRDQFIWEKYGVDVSDLCWGENERYKVVCDECQ